VGRDGDVTAEARQQQQLIVVGDERGITPGLRELADPEDG
jgi:hypothetical protein